MEKTFYSTSEVAELFGISRVTVYRWAKDGKIQACGLGKNLKIPLYEIKRLLQDFGKAGMSSDEIDLLLRDHEIREIIQRMAKDGRPDPS